ncbi:MAG: hypothetical protein ACTS8P_02380 [Arsenophonus sp. NC-XBC3-MAG3]
MSVVKDKLSKIKNKNNSEYERSKIEREMMQVKCEYGRVGEWVYGISIEFKELS